MIFGTEIMSAFLKNSNVTCLSKNNVAVILDNPTDFTVDSFSQTKWSQRKLLTVRTVDYPVTGTVFLERHTAVKYIFIML